MFVCSDNHARAYQRSAATNKTVDCGSEMLPHLPFFMDLTPSGSNLLPNMKKTLESYVFADNEEMIASLMTMQDMFEMFFFKECLGAWVKSCDKFENMNDDYIDQQHFLSLSYLPIYAPSWSGRELFEHPSYISIVLTHVFPFDLLLVGAHLLKGPSFVLSHPSIFKPDISTPSPDPV